MTTSTTVSMEVDAAAAMDGGTCAGGAGGAVVKNVSAGRAVDNALKNVLGRCRGTSVVGSVGGPASGDGGANVSRRVSTTLAAAAMNPGNDDAEADGIAAAFEPVPMTTEVLTSRTGCPNFADKANRPGGDLVITDAPPGVGVGSDFATNLRIATNDGDLVNKLDSAVVVASPMGFDLGVGGFRSVTPSEVSTSVPDTVMPAFDVHLGSGVVGPRRSGRQRKTPVRMLREATRPTTTKRRSSRRRRRRRR